MCLGQVTSCCTFLSGNAPFTANRLSLKKFITQKEYWNTFPLVDHYLTRRLELVARYDVQCSLLSDQVVKTTLTSMIRDNTNSLQPICSNGKWLFYMLWGEGCNRVLGILMISLCEDSRLKDTPNLNVKTEDFKNASFEDWRFGN